MEEYRRILERAANGQLPDRTEEQSEPDFRFIRELYEDNCLTGLDVSSRDRPQGGAYLGLRITPKGREYLQRLTQAAPANKP